jgi:hypothetical protein
MNQHSLYSNEQSRIMFAPVQSVKPPYKTNEAPYEISFCKTVIKTMGVNAKHLYMLKHEEQEDYKFGEIIRKVLLNQYPFKLKELIIHPRVNFIRSNWQAVQRRVSSMRNRSISFMIVTS